MQKALFHSDILSLLIQEKARKNILKKAYYLLAEEDNSLRHRIKQSQVSSTKLWPKQF